MTKKKRIYVWLLILSLIAGLVLLLYPSFANYINELHGSKAISEYSGTVSNMDRSRYEEIIQSARDYNQALFSRTSAYYLDEDETADYLSQLDVDGRGIMGYIEIPTIEVSLPIYHGTDDRVLQTAVGHLDWTSLPVGGESTHCVLSGHRGLPNAKLFTNLDKLAEGDIFMLRILNEVLTYEVDQILIVLPEDASALHIENGQDYCTLLTCTPYGINSHRLLVRGHRIANTAKANSVHITSEALVVATTVVAAILTGPLFLLMMIISVHRSKKRGDEEDT